MKSASMAALVGLAMATSGTAAAGGLTPGQQSEVAARLELAKLIVSRPTADSLHSLNSAHAPALKLALVQKLLALPSSSLRALAADGTISSTRDLVAKANAAKRKPAGKALGDLNEDLVFTPITPCRLADSRSDVLPGPIVGPFSQGYSEEDSGLQGGDAGCSAQLAAFPEASAYALNLTVVNMNTQSFIAIRPVGASEVTSIINFTGPGQQVNNFVIVQNLQNSGNEFEVFVPAGVSLDVIIDVFGIFMPPEATALECQNTAATSQALGAGANDVTVTSAACATGFTAVSGNCNETAGFTASLVRHQVSGNAWSCTWDNGGTPSTVSVSARCCRVPGR